ncbi:MAG: HAD hydrolase-like protein [Nitriliruptorales bacterium]|nr:HAD hydrolase-like protein [Nitriliruptorales bacterium]
MRRSDAPDLVCLDLDGCLVDSSAAIPRAINRALEQLGIAPRPRASLRSFIGPPLLDSFRVLLEEEGRDPAAAPRGVEVYREAYPEISLAHTTVVPGIPGVLDELAAASELRVVTSKPREFAVPILERLGLTGTLRAVHAPALDALEETKSETLASALGDAGVLASAAVMVGDHPADVRAARANDVRSVAVTWGSASAEELRGAGADRVVQRPSELLAAVQLPRRA